MTYEPDVERLPSGLVVPRLLSFYQDEYDDEGTNVGWRTVAWGLRRHDGVAVTIPVAGPPSASLWLTVDDAATSLDAYLDGLDPRRFADVWRTDG